MAEKSQITIFVSSPGDVAEERTIAKRVVTALNQEFGTHVEILPYFWEDGAVLASETPQAQLIRPSETDIFLCILWGRLGTPVPADFETRPDGSIYESGTAFEFEDARRGSAETGSPAMLVYRKSSAPVVALDSPWLTTQIAQREALGKKFHEWFFNDDGSMRGGFLEFTEIDEFERLILRDLRDVVSRLVARAEDEAGRPAATWHRGSPFRGLNAFDFDDAPIYFGRTRAASEVLEQWSHQAQEGRALIVIYGMSGSGKSSLMRAGVLPNIVEPGVVEGVDFWRRATLQFSYHSGNIFEWLAEQLVGETALPELLDAGIDVASLAHAIRADPTNAVLSIRVGLARAAEVECEKLGTKRKLQGRLVLLVDQLEELFTLPAMDDETRTALAQFFAALAQAAPVDGQPGELVWVGATMRGDFHDHLTELPELYALCNPHGEYHLGPPRRIEVADMIQLPARIAGLKFESDASGVELSAVIEEATISHPGTLPLLQFLLDELYKRRRDEFVLTRAAYDELGGLTGALITRAEEIYLDLPLDVQASLPRILELLCNFALGDDDDPAAVSAPLASFVPGSSERALVEAFLDPSARLLVVDGLAEGARVRVAHEALLSRWDRARDLIGEQQDSYRIRTRVNLATQQWQAQDQSDAFLLPAGGPLVEAETLLTDWRSSLDEPAADFIERSLRQEKHMRNRRGRRLLAVTGLVSALALASIGGLFTTLNSLEAEKRSVEEAKRNQKIALDAAETMVSELAAPLRHLARVSIDDVNDLLISAETIYSDLLETTEQTDDVRMSQSKILLAFADVAEALGHYERSLKRATAARDLLGALLQSSTVDGVPNELARSHIAVGDALVRLERNLEARESYQAASEIRITLQKSGDPAITRDLAAVYQRLGDMEFGTGQAEKALSQYRDARALLDGLPDGPLAEKEWQRDRAVIRNKIGGVLLDQDKLTSAIDNFLDARKLFVPLVDGAREVELWQRDLAQTETNLALAYIADRRPLDAHDAVTRAVEILENLYHQDEANAANKRALAVSYYTRGDVFLQSRNEARAKVAFQSGLDLIGTGEPALQRDRAIGHERLGDTARALGEDVEVLRQYRLSLELIQDPTLSIDRETAWRRDVAASHHKLALALIDQGLDKEARFHLAAGTSDLVLLREQNEYNARWSRELAELQNDLAWLLSTSKDPAVHAPDVAVEHAESAVALTRGQAPRHIDTLAMIRFATGDRAEALVLIDQALALRDTVTLKPDDWAEIERHRQLIERSTTPSR